VLSTTYDGRNFTIMLYVQKLAWFELPKDEWIENNLRHNWCRSISWPGNIG